MDDFWIYAGLVVALLVGAAAFLVMISWRPPRRGARHRASGPRSLPARGRGTAPRRRSR